MSSTLSWRISCDEARRFQSYGAPCVNTSTAVEAQSALDHFDTCPHCRSLDSNALRSASASDKPQTDVELPSIVDLMQAVEATHSSHESLSQYVSTTRQGAVRVLQGLDTGTRDTLHQK